MSHLKDSRDETHQSRSNYDHQLDSCTKLKLLFCVNGTN